VNGDRDHRRWRADLAAHTLGSLEPEEEVALARHLETCERCRDELRWLQPAIDLIAESVPQLEPPPGIRARLMAEVRSDAAEAEAPSAGWEARRTGERRAPSRRGIRGFFWRPAVGVTAMALVVAVVAGYALRGGGEGAQTSTTQTVAQGGAVHATLEKSGDSGTLMLTGLKQARAGHVYQAWVERGGKILPSSLFEARNDGSASTAIPHQLDGAKRVMVTVEPHGGSDQPTSAPIVTVTMAG
jgi:anti-sigma-K factor RskA